MDLIELEKVYSMDADGAPGYCGGVLGLILRGRSSTLGSDTPQC